jgi:hypothetical protein
MRHRGGPPQPLSAWLPFGQGPIAEAADAISRARARAGALPPAEAVSPTAPPKPEFTSFETSQPRPPAPAPSAAADSRPSNEGGKQATAPEPRPNSPEDAGFLTPEQLAAARLDETPTGGAGGDRGRGAAAGQPQGEAQPLPGAAPRHAPRLCSSCSAPIYWAQLLDDAGQRVRRDDDKGWKSMPIDPEPSITGNVQVFHRPGEGIVCRVYRDRVHAPPGAILRTSHFATCPNASQHRRSRR